MVTLRAGALAPLPGLGGPKLLPVRPPRTLSAHLQQVFHGQEDQHPPGRVWVEALDPCSPLEGEKGRTKMGLYWNLLQ